MGTTESLPQDIDRLLEGASSLSPLACSIQAVGRISGVVLQRTSY